MKYTASLLLPLFLFCACGGPKHTNLSPQASKDTIKDVPEWFLEPPTDEDHLYATASSTSRDLQMALDKARTIAQVDLAQQLGVHLGNLTRQFSEETGLAQESALMNQFSTATKTVTDQSMSGARAARQQLVAERAIYRAYVQMVLPIGAANQLLMERIRSNQQLYTRLRATQAYADLDDELRALAERESASDGSGH